MTTTTAVLLLSVVACTPQPAPDEAEFVRQAVKLTVDGLHEPSGTIVVLDRDYLAEMGSGAFDTVSAALSAANVAWEEAHLGSDISDLPGSWDRTGSFPINRSHALLSIAVTSKASGRERTVQFSYICGPLCGYGERYAFHWEPDGWRHEREAIIRY